MGPNGGTPPRILESAIEFCQLSNVLIGYMQRRVLWEVLPDLQPGAAEGPSTTSVSSLETSVERVMNVMLQVKEDKVVQKAKRNQSVSITALYPEDMLLPQLLMLTHLDDIDVLPSVYAKLAQFSKKVSVHMQLQLHYNKVARKLGTTTAHLQPGISTCFRTLRPEGINPYKFSSGVLLMMIIPTETHSAAGWGLQEETVRANDNLRLMLEATGVQTSNLFTLNKTKGFIVVHYNEGILQIQEFRPLLACLLRLSQVVFLDFFGVLKLVICHKICFVCVLDKTYGSQGGLPLLVYFFHYYLQQWFTK